ncbi:MAG: FHA domain-containing protein [Lachnospiraceae bacterium]|nr:FHA domain-containing protein [Lachnospiraceae bacterium]
MSKFKVKIKDNRLVIKYSQNMMLSVNQREMGMLDKGAVEGFMKPQWITAGTMEFEAPTSLTLKKYLSKRGSISKVYDSILNTLKVINTAVNNSLEVRKISFDINTIGVDENMNKLYFVYEPYEISVQNEDVMLFLNSVIKNSKIKEASEKIKLEELKNYISSHQNFSDIESYIITQFNIKAMYGNSKNESNYIERNAKGHPFAMNIGTAEILNKNKDYFDEETGLLGMEDEGTSVLSPEEGFDQETTLLRPDPVLHLRRKKDGMSMKIETMTYAIGRSEDNDWAIRDNTDISRHHAVIKREGEGFYIKDVGSLNGTSINGSKLVKDENGFLRNGDIVNLGGEDFECTIE